MINAWEYHVTYMFAVLLVKTLTHSFLYVLWIFLYIFGIIIKMYVMYYS